MNYRHIYHVGNFADVFKHLVLIALLQALQRKDSAFCYLETHAGIGYYDLSNEAAQKTLEYKSGIEIILQSRDYPEVVKTYCDIVTEYNPAGNLRYYPGSPVIAQHLLRPQDRMVLAELHPEDAHELKKLFKGEKQIAVHHQNGYAALKAFIPPLEKRGLVLIDPPFEETNEWETILTALMRALKHWTTGIYAIWYPIKKETEIHKIIRQLKNLTTQPLLQIEILQLPNDIAQRLNGCGIVVINPPWKIEEEVQEILSFLKTALKLHQTGFSYVY